MKKIQYKTITIILLFLIFIIMKKQLIANSKINWYDVDGCKIELLDEVLSQDAKKAILIENELCIGGIIISTQLNLYLDDKINNTRTIIMTRAYSKDNKFVPEIKWVDNFSVDLTVENATYIGRIIQEYNGIRFKVKFNPDDKQERRRFLERLNVEYKNWWMYNIEP